jgi:hypothetical protein
LVEASVIIILPGMEFIGKNLSPMEINNEEAKGSGRIIDNHRIF